VRYPDASSAVYQVEVAFQAWLAIQTDASAVMFPQELLYRGIMRR
jgi:hypothetical protein